MEFTTVMATFGPSRIDPRAENAVPFAAFSYERNHENYRINRLVLSWGEKTVIRKITMRSLDKGYRLLIYGMFI